VVRHDGRGDRGQPLNLHWESTGDGEPVLLIAGLALTGAAWWRTVPVLSRRFRVLTYDHRGVGRSPSNSHTYSTSAMADDAASVLDAAGVTSAHVYGISLGGMVAQQLALRNPGRVRSLVLGATHAGGARAVGPDEEVLAFFRRRPSMAPDEAAWASVAYNYGPRSRAQHVDRIAEDLARRLEHTFPAQAYRAQLGAGALHNCFGRLRQLRTPTLVLHGRHDRVIPVENADLLADAVPDAQLRILEDSGHIYPTEEPDVDETIAGFLEAVR
jgi:3-oxoadipate enol-lactonase